MFCFGNFRRHKHSLNTILGSDEVEAHSRYSKDPILSLNLLPPSYEYSLELFNQLLELYSSMFLTTTTLDLWFDRKYGCDRWIFLLLPHLPFLHQRQNLESLMELLSLSATIFPKLFLTRPPAIPCATDIMIGRYTNGRNMQCACWIPPMASWNPSTPPRNIFIWKYFIQSDCRGFIKTCKSTSLASKPVGFFKALELLVSAGGGLDSSRVVFKFHGQSFVE